MKLDVVSFYNYYILDIVWNGDRQMRNATLIDIHGVIRETEKFREVLLDPATRQTAKMAKEVCRLHTVFPDDGIFTPKWLSNKLLGGSLAR